MSTQRSFSCPNCQGAIYIPSDLPPTTAPCPLCNALITSPALEPVQQATTQIAPVTTPQTAPQAASVVRPQVVSPSTTVVQKPITSRITSADLPIEPKSSIVPWIVALLLILGMTAGAYFLYHKFIKTQTADKTPNSTLTEIIPAKIIPKDPDDVSPTDAKMLESEFTNEGWKAEAKITLDKFITAKTPSEKAKYVIGGEQTLKRLLNIYGARIMDESESPADAFVPVDLGDEDSSRKIFMMAYDRPGQFELSKFFRPLASIEIQHGLEELNPMVEASTKVYNFAMEPMKIQAFFKSTEQGMLIDWDVYLQTRYRTFQAFVERKSKLESGIFRVIIVEEMPSQNEKNQHVRIYRITDPAYINDSYRIAVPIGSAVETSLKKINWYGSDSLDASVATATLEMTASDDNAISISRLVCWEFDGLGGGELGNKNQSNKSAIISPLGESDDALVEPSARDKQ